MMYLIILLDCNRTYILLNGDMWCWCFWFGWLISGCVWWWGWNRCNARNSRASRWDCCKEETGPSLRGGGGAWGHTWTSFWEPWNAHQNAGMRLFSQLQLRLHLNKLFWVFYDKLSAFSNIFCVLSDKTDDGGCHKANRREEETTELFLFSPCLTSKKNTPPPQIFKI